MRKFLTTALLLLLSISGLLAQNVSDLIISEALAQPDSTGIMDQYGRRSGWIELFNVSTGTVNYGGCYLTDDRSSLRKSLIPKSDARTKLGPRQSVVFFCSDNADEGTFYTGFTLAPGKTVYLVSNDGRTIIDSLSIPVSLPRGKSVAKLSHDLRGQVFEPATQPMTPSPGMLNSHGSAQTRVESLQENDPHGWILTLVAVAVVFSALAILWFLFWLLFDRPARNGMPGQAGHDGPFRHSRPDRESLPEGEVAAAIALALDMERGGDTYAAIATAVHLYLSECVHDTEPLIVTIRRSETSGWHNKALNFRKIPLK